MSQPGSHGIRRRAAVRRAAAHGGSGARFPGTGQHKNERSGPQFQSAHGRSAEKEPSRPRDHETDSPSARKRQVFVSIRAQREDRYPRWNGHPQRAGSLERRAKSGGGQGSGIGGGGGGG